MREIKFRGKRILEPINIDQYAPNGWVYGGLIDCSNEMYILPYDVSGEMYIDRPYRFRANDYECRVMLAQVEPKSIGQFTGLRDKNGKEIYEGDIVEFEYKSTHSKGIAKIEYALYKWKYNGCYYNQNIAVWLDICDTDVVFEVIGNIWDNPELLSGEKD